MTGHYFENSFVRLHYYRFGTGARHMLCFHGLGMHGKQFQVLKDALGHKYTFFGFDLLFHKETKLMEDSLPVIKAGMQKDQLTSLIKAFCQAMHITRFSLIGYSMGTHYATAIVEGLPEMVNEFIVAAPSSIEPGNLIRFMSKNYIGNKILEKLMLSDKGMKRLISWSRRFGIIDTTASEILYNEVATPALRLALYSCFTYLRFLETNENLLISNLNTFNIRAIFIFGERDEIYPATIGKRFLSKLQKPEVAVVDCNHDMINDRFACLLYKLL